LLYQQNKYQEEYKKNRGNFTPLPETNEMVLSKKLQPIVSQKAYTEKSKDLMPYVTIGPVVNCL